MSVQPTKDRDNAEGPPILVGEVEAHRLMGVSRPTFRGWVDDGLISPVTLPHGMRRRLYRRRDLETLADLLAAGNHAGGTV